MIQRRRYLIAIVALLLIAYFFVSKNDLNYLLNYSLESSTGNELHVWQKEDIHLPVYSNEDHMALAVVVCGDRFNESLIMIKSALLFTKKPLKIYIFTDEKLIERFKEKLKTWQVKLDNSFDFDVRLVKFPPGEFEAAWRKLFRPCAAQRLFFPSLLENVDSLLYVDTDTIFLGPVDQVWTHFKQMNSSQIAALAQEDVDARTGWYARFARHPFYKPLGVNTGVMLMNLTRMRNFEWERYMVPIYKKYKLKIPWGDQDIVNIVFSYHPDKLYIYSCKYNYRSDHCVYSSVCKDAEKDGIVVLHGSRFIFHSDKHPPFRSVYKAVEEYEIGTDSYDNFYLPLERYLNSSTASNCGKLGRIFLKNVKNFIHQPYDLR